LNDVWYASSENMAYILISAQTSKALILAALCNRG
jgi:hypothetical protein